MAVAVNPAHVHASAQLGRSGGPELFTTVNYADLAQTLINRNVSLQRPLSALWLRFRGRVVIGTANYSAVAAEAPQSIINRIRVYGTWRNGQQVPVDISGATAFVLARIYNVYGNSLLIGGTRQTDPSLPFGQVGTTFGNTGTYDLEIFYKIPVGPFLPHATRAGGNYRFWWLPEDWNDSLQIQINFGDKTSFGTPAGGTTVALTAYGSGAGTPTVDVLFNYEQLGSIRGTYHSALLIRNEQNIVGGAVGAAGNNIQILPLSKNVTTNVLIKTGQVLTGTSGGVFVFASLSDDLLEQTMIVNDNKIIRNNYINHAAKESQARVWDSIIPQGYLPFSFIDSGNPRAAYRADNRAVVGPGAQYAIMSNVITPGSNPAAGIIQEQVYYQTGDPFWTSHAR